MTRKCVRTAVFRPVSRAVVVDIYIEKTYDEIYG